MQIFRKIYRDFYFAKLLFTALLLLQTVSCSTINEANSSNSNQSANANAENSTIDKDDIAELGSIIKLPELPDETATVWREEETSDPKGKKLTAILKYSPEISARITAQAEKNKSPAPTEIGTESWYPEELTAQSQLSGDESLKGTAYGADDFFNAPYINGRLIRVEKTDFFILELTTY